jgi:MFS family permease
VTSPNYLHRGLWTLLLAALSIDLAVSMVTLAVQFLGIKLGASAMLLGLYGTVASGIYGAAALVSGRASDHFGRRLAALSVVLTAAVWLSLGFQKSPRMLLVLLPISSFMLAFFWPPVQAWIGDLVSGRKQLNTVLGNFNVLWTAGLMLGPVVCAYLWVAKELAPFIGAAAIAVVMAGALMTVPMKKSEAAPSKADGADIANGDELDAVDERADFYLPLAWAANFVSWAAVGLIRTLFPKLAHDIGFSEVLTGWLTFAYYLGQLGVFVAVRQITSWQYRRWPLVVGLLGGMAGMTGAWLGRSPIVFAVSFAAAGLSVGLTYVASLYYSLHAPRERRGRRAGIHEMTVGAGGALGPLLGGTVATYYGVRSSFAALAVMFAVAAVVLVVWSVVRRRPKAA